MKATIKAVIFDLDNTLYDENNLVKAVCEEFCQFHKLQPHLISSILQDRFRVRSQDIFGDWLKSFDFYTPERKEELFSLYSTLPQNKFRSPLKLYNDAIDFLNFLTCKNLKLGILTNGRLSAQKHKIHLLGLEHSPWGFHIEYARSRGKEYEKPHADAFLRILNALKLNADECIFIGDNPLTDIKGANNAGIYSIWIQRGYARFILGDQAKMSITNFNELKNIWS